MDVDILFFNHSGVVQNHMHLHEFAEVSLIGQL
jgi:hypothetical protein